MTVYEAIHQMRELTAKGQPFALSYMTYSRTRRESHGEVACEHALLVKNQKPAAAATPAPTVPAAAAAPASAPTASPTVPGGFIAGASAVPAGASDIMLTYRDQDTGEARHFYQPLLMSFQHQPVDLT